MGCPDFRKRQLTELGKMESEEKPEEKSQDQNFKFKFLKFDFCKNNSGAHFNFYYFDLCHKNVRH